MPKKHLKPSHPKLSRRSAIQAGSIGLLGLGMNHLSLLEAAEKGKGGQPNRPKANPKAKSVIYIFLSGGLSQIESFDMKPDASEEIRGEFKSIATRTPGLRICEHMPELARRSDKWAICRSLTHGSNEHSQGHHIMLTGRSDMPRGFDPQSPKETDWPSIAAIANDVVPARSNLPPAIVLPEKLVHRTGRVIPGQFAGHMGSQRDPFFLSASRFNPLTYGAFPEYAFHHAKGRDAESKLRYSAPNFALPEGLSRDRMFSRLGLVKELEGQRREFDQVAGGFDRYRQMAVSLLSDPKTQAAFDVHGADPKLLDKYGRNSFGWSLLQARQLVEAGVRLVQVNLGNNECWDTHQAVFPNLKNFLFPPMDKSVSALLDDLGDRGMLDDTLVVMAGEFGRTPKITTLPSAKLPGRDHWGALQTVFFAGAGVPGGAIIGKSDKLGGYPTDDPQKPENFASTIYRALGIPSTMPWYDSVDRPHFIHHGNPIPGLIS